MKLSRKDRHDAVRLYLDARRRGADVVYVEIFRSLALSRLWLLKNGECVVEGLFNYEGDEK